MTHARSFPDLTLGVAAFSQSQMQVILDELELLRRQDQSCEYFFAAHPEEPFFVKNLENVQGDERDVILISVGYGRTAEGFVSMNFGPLNQDGGERRLNVLITRARRRCEVFTNLRADDLDLQRAKGRGVAALKRYLRYAELDILDLPSASALEAESRFEEQVADALRAHGHTVEHQVGTGGFLIDLAVVDPGKPGRYRLGIECDGASYHSARWARDRDRLRLEVLEALGWRIHRIWSTDWFYNAERETRRVLEAIEAATSTAPVSVATSLVNPRASERETAVLREEATVNDRQQAADAPVLPPYRKAELAIHLGGLEIFEIDAERVGAWVAEVVQVESPVHMSEVVTRISEAAGYTRAGRRIREAVERGMVRAARGGRIRFDSEQFLWAAEMSEPLPRDRSTLSAVGRRLELVSPREIGVQIVTQVKAAHGVSRSQLVASVCRQFGFARVTAGMQQKVDLCIDMLLQSRWLVTEGDHLVVREPTDPPPSPGC